MARICVIKVYLTRPAYEKVKQDAALHKHRTVSGYIRATITRNTLLIDQRIIENNRILKRLEQHFLKTKNNA